MKKILFVFVFALTWFHAFSQNQVNEVKKPGVYYPDGTKLDEYQITFEIKDNPNPNKEELCKVNAAKYWRYIQENSRTEVYDEITGFTLILYSRQEMEQRIGNLPNAANLLYVVTVDDGPQNKGQ